MFIYVYSIYLKTRQIEHTHIYTNRQTCVQITHTHTYLRTQA